MDRRSFLRLMGLASAAVGVGFSIDITPTPEVVAEAARISGVSLTEMDMIVASQYMNRVADQFLRNSPILDYLKRDNEMEA